MATSPNVAHVRIASLLPSATEIAFALGLGDDVVAVTFECNHPGDPRVGRAVVVGGIDSHGMSAEEIDAAVRARVAAGENLYELDRSAFADVAPELVLTQDLCRVCALPGASVDEAMAELGCAATVITLDPHCLADVMTSIEAVGSAAGVGARATELVAALRQRLAKVRAAVTSRPLPRVFVLEWPDPPFVAGHWVPELVSAAGGEPVLARAGERSVPTTWDAVAAADPDVVVIASCGFDVDGTAAHGAEVMAHLPPHAEVWAIDADGLIVRPGPRLVDGVETLASMLHGVGSLDPTRARCLRGR